jgi:hypothetical protein
MLSHIIGDLITYRDYSFRIYWPTATSTYTKIEPFPKYLLWLINQPYKLEYDSFYNIDDSKIKQKYLKYKNKYLQLKSKLTL